MGAETKIQWTDTTWNPVRGCARVSEGCRNCYAERVAHRFSGPGQPYEGLTRQTSRGPQWTGAARFVPEMLGAPLRWRKPRRVFVNSMSDLFHADITNEQIAAVFGVMATAPQHTFQILTKRPAQMVEWLQWAKRCFDRGALPMSGIPLSLRVPCEPIYERWPLPNVHIGVSVEDQRSADERIPLLLQCPAAVRWVSYEPALGAVDLWAIGDGSWYDREGATRYNALTGAAWHGGSGDHGMGGGPRLDWIVVGGESGPNARPCDVEWIRGIVEQCKGAGVPCFVKQIGRFPYSGRNGAGWAYPVNCPGPAFWAMDERRPESGLTVYEVRDRKGGDPDEWPADLRVREVPDGR